MGRSDAPLRVVAVTLWASIGYWQHFVREPKGTDDDIRLKPLPSEHKVPLHVLAQREKEKERQKEQQQQNKR